MKYSENTVLLNKLAEQTEDFAVQLIDQVSVSEKLVIRNKPDESHRYASLLSPMTDDAIKYSQKKVGVWPQSFRWIATAFLPIIPCALSSLFPGSLGNIEHRRLSKERFPIDPM